MRGERLDKAKVIALRKFSRKYSADHFPRSLDFAEWKDRTLKHIRKTGTPCSCASCGNPRKYFNEPTIQEKRAMQ